MSEMPAEEMAPIEERVGRLHAEMTFRPHGHVEIRLEPDGTYELYWGEDPRVSLLLSREQLRHMVSAGLNMTMESPPRRGDL